ncbi:MAG: hypothetical protein HFI85_02575 [Clostridia bacterium]|jgi:protein arginine kinase|nr:hypothetical protein [Clostridia bacterium]
MEIFDNIAISSRIRLARNVEGIKFYTKLQSDVDAKYIEGAVIKTLEKYDTFNILSLKDLSLNECNALFEQHLISKELIENKDISGVAISEDGKIIVMINEEDHIREQCIEKGFNLYKPFRRLSQIDDEILKSLPISYDEELGFITASPSNLGTGMRASVMLFLPACELSGRMDEIFARAKDNGLTIRGIYGEGSKALGYFYQISNQGSLGFDENEIIDKVSEFIYSLCNEEKEMREALIQEDYEKYRDMTLRAYGTITNCYSLQESEMMELLAKVKLGQVLGFIDISSDDKFQKLFYEGCSANLGEIFELFNQKKENIVRAEYISNKVRELAQRRL